MPEAATGSGAKVSGYTEITNGVCENCHIPMDVIDDVYHCPICSGSKGELLVAFNSLQAGDHWGNEYQKERITYCMRHRRDKIPEHLRTGGKLHLFKGKKGEAERLKELNLKEVQDNG